MLCSGSGSVSHSTPPPPELRSVRETVASRLTWSWGGDQYLGTLAQADQRRLRQPLRQVTGLTCKVRKKLNISLLVSIFVLELVLNGLCH